MWRVKMAEKLVRDLMHRGVVTCYNGTPLREVARIMIQNNIREVVVIGDRAQVSGVISDHLLVRKAYDGDLDKMVAEDILLPYTVTISPDAPLTEAIKLMQKKSIRNVVIVTDEWERRPVGILSCTDIVREMAELESILPYFSGF
jgi:CBS domain-containing protein